MTLQRNNRVSNEICSVIFFSIKKAIFLLRKPILNLLKVFSVDKVYQTGERKDLDEKPKGFMFCGEWKPIEIKSRSQPLGSATLQSLTYNNF